MFVKLIRGLDDGSGQRRTEVYECTRYSITPVKDAATQFLISMADPHGDEVESSYSTDETDLQVYVVSEAGNTIETVFRSASRR